MSNLTTTKLADELGLSKGRISQYVSSGKLDGCFVGDGRARRFDLNLVRTALGKQLDPGQMLGNGAETKKALSKTGPAKSTGGQKKSSATKLDDGDVDAYQLVRTQKAKEDLRATRRRNEEDEGNFVLASSVGLQTTRLIAQEVAEFEGVLKEGARKVADELGIDVMKVRAILMAEWREHRGLRSKSLSNAAANAELTDEEKDRDI
jgi:hypothetical protein